MADALAVFYSMTASLVWEQRGHVPASLVWEKGSHGHDSSIPRMTINAAEQVMCITGCALHGCCPAEVLRCMHADRCTHWTLCHDGLHPMA
eukprot:1159406-Pelagomonas_calceolata.AAC.17